MATTVDSELDIVHSDEPAAIAEGSHEIVPNITGGIEHQSEIEQETLSTALSPPAQETGVDVVPSSKDAVVAHEVEAEVEAEKHGTDAATATHDLVITELPETEQPVIPTTEVFISCSCGNALADLVLPRKGNSNKHVNEAVIVALGLATAEEISSMDKVVPEVTHEATPEAGNNSVESEPQQEHEVDVTVPEAEDTLPDIHSSLRNDPAPVSLPFEPEISPIETGLVAEHSVESTSSVTTNSIPIDVELQPDTSSSETAPDAQKDVEVQTQVNDTSNIKDEPILKSDIPQQIEAADTEGPLEDVPASSTEQSQDTVQMEPEVDIVAPAEEEPSAITQVAAENLLPKIESEDTISQTPDEAIPISKDATAFVANAEDQIIAPVDDRSEHAAVVETSSIDELAGAILPPNVEESPETLTPQVEPSNKSSNNEMVGVSVLPISATQKLKLTL